MIGTATTPINPLLGPLQFNGGPTRTHPLLLGSPAINKGGSAGSLPSFDQRGFPFRRFSGAGVDIGAVEVQQNPTDEGIRAAALAIALLRRSGAHFASFDFADVGGDFFPDTVIVMRLRNNKLLVASFDGIDGHVLGAFQPFVNAVGASTAVRVLTLNLNADPALEIGIIVMPGSLGVPHISAFTVTGTRIF
jgi:hypothetical protein